MNKLLRFSLWILGLSLAFLVACSKPETVTGTATDAENTIAGIVLDSLLNPVAGVQIRIIYDSSIYQNHPLGLRKHANFAPTDEVVFSQTDGTFKIHYPLNDSFALSFKQHSRAVVQQIGLLKNLHGTQLKPAVIDTVVLRKPAVLKGFFNYQIGDNPLYTFSEHFRLIIKGTGINIPLLANRAFAIPEIPPGQHIAQIYPADSLLSQTLISAGLPKDSLALTLTLDFAPGDTTWTPTLHWRLPPSFQWEQLDTRLQSRPTIGGCAIDELKNPLPGAQIRIITDFDGFSYSNDPEAEFPFSDSTWALTDQKGCWSLPLWADSFNIEHLYYEAGKITKVALVKGLSKQNLLDNNQHSIGTVRLKKAAEIRGEIRYIHEPSAWVTIGAHFKVGIKGTSRYVHTHNQMFFDLPGLPDSLQSLIFYPGDLYVADFFADKGVSDAFVQKGAQVHLKAGDLQEMHAITYSLPLLNTVPD